jgi:hypothetical protein
VIRRPAVAGSFYPGNRRSLEESLKELFSGPAEAESARGIIVPHAGYIYSGQCAASAYRKVKIPPVVVILGVDHHGSGASCAIDAHDEWETPLGKTLIASSLRDRLAAGEIFRVDPRAGLAEHSLEVQLPFLQFLRPDVRILPLTFNVYQFAKLEQAGLELAAKLQEEDFLLLISTDFSHFIPSAQAEESDRLALDAIRALDAARLYETIVAHDLSICGLAPLTAGLTALSKMDARECELVCYTNSGAATGDSRSVVAYASLIIK